MIEIARAVCLAAHAGQVDKAGKPYFLHPFVVATKMSSEKAKIVAYLHDVVEDTPIGLEDLAMLGFGEDILKAVSLLTHDTGVSYDDYIACIKENDLAREVKIADLKHNMDLSRLGSVSQSDIQRRDKYKKALDYLRLTE